MRSFFSLSSLLLLPVIGLMLNFALPTETFKVNVAASQIVWKAYKVAGSHNGKLKIKSGTLTTNKGMLVGGSFEIDMISMTCDDLSGESANSLMGHLKSDDFFSVAKHPTASFVTTKVASKGTPGIYKVTGNLTIKGITKEVRFDANFADGAGAATIKLDRTDFDVRYGSGSFFDSLGDKTIYDEFDLVVALVAAR